MRLLLIIEKVEQNVIHFGLTNKVVYVSIITENALQFMIKLIVIIKKKIESYLKVDIFL